MRYMIKHKVVTAKWAEARARLTGLPVDAIDADQSMVDAAGEMKASHKISHADCFAAVLAKQKKAEIYTGDPEFKAIESDLKIMWL